MTKLQYPLFGPQVCLQRAAYLTCLVYRVTGNNGTLFPDDLALSNENPSSFKMSASTHRQDRRRPDPSGRLYFVSHSGMLFCEVKCDETDERLIMSSLFSGQRGIVPVHAMKANRGSRSLAPLILDLGTRRR